MPRVTYKGRNVHREVKTDMRYLFFFPNVPMTIDSSEVPIIEGLVKAGEPYSIEYSPSEQMEDDDVGNKADESGDDTSSTDDTDVDDVDDIEDLI